MTVEREECAENPACSGVRHLAITQDLVPFNRDKSTKKRHVIPASGVWMVGLETP